MRFDVALFEKNGADGLTKSEICTLYDMVAEDVFPLDIEAKEHECAAEGFISVKAAEKLSYDYKTSGFIDFIQNILDDMEKESENGIYNFKSLTISLTRN